MIPFPTEFKHKPKPRPQPSLMFKHVEARKKDPVTSGHSQEKQAGPKCSQKDPKDIGGNKEPLGHKRVQSDHHQGVSEPRFRQLYHPDNVVLSPAASPQDTQRESSILTQDILDAFP